MHKSHDTELPYKLAVLRDRNKDLKQVWYVEFYAWDEVTSKLVRKRTSISMNFRDVKSRTAEGNRLVRACNDLLKKGYHFKKQAADLKPDAIKKNDDLIKALEFILSATSVSVSAKTIISYQAAINKLKLFADKRSLYISEFKSGDAILFRDFMLNNLKNSARTANNTTQFLLSMFSKYQERTGIEINPFKVKSLKEPATMKNVAFTDEDKATVEKELMLHHPELYLFTRMIYYGFIRPGEILKLQFGHVRMQEGYVLVHGLMSKSGKTETAQIIPALAHELQTRMVFMKPDYYLFSAGMKPGKFPLSKQVPFRRHEKVLEKLGLIQKGYTLYSWKHTGAVKAYKAGVGIKELQGLLRHSSIQITDIYLKSLGLRTDPNIKNYNW
ncbi:site-specific integrase [Dyadobacter sp. CY326]|uniref:tyrosine-type recombinase/integrase n=1 Tax=Dyadobacter sp. CY326 TaxID=2907300 RepID=UPI001F40FD97|nr:site-specific integrase [Dyadobacter sp. CY326]MCE7063832.1 site-specific integrase [Dyadobacter sp. CY326]